MRTHFCFDLMVVEKAPHVNRVNPVFIRSKEGILNGQPGFKGCLLNLRELRNRKDGGGQEKLKEKLKD